MSKVTLSNTSALVVLSGGQDSTTCLFWAISQGYKKVAAISFDYGQRHIRELDSAAFVYELARRSKPADIEMPDYRIVKRLPSFAGNSPLTNKQKELETYNSVTEMDAKLQDRIELTFVPGRNAVFLAAAAGIAVAGGYGAVITGVNGADNANYPDCTPSFIEAMEEALQLATASDIQIITPLQGLSKGAICNMATELSGCLNALAFTTTDYAGEYPPGRNHASVLRASGFKEVGIEDPLIVRARMEGLL